VVDAGAQPCASEKTTPAAAATEGQGVFAARYERAGWDGSWRLRRSGVPPVARRSRRRKTSLLSRVKFVLRTTR
jgi:hypothetical protein